MRFIRLVLACIPAMAILAGCTPRPDHWASAKVIGSLNDAIGGVKALARPGDFLLENDQVRVAILSGTVGGDVRRSDMGPGLYGGSIIDADLQWNDPEFTSGHGNDQFAELFPTESMNVQEPLTDADVSIIADGSDGGPATVRVRSKAVPFLEMLKALWAVVKQPDSYLVTDYTVEPGKPWVEITTTAYFGWDGTGEMPPSEPIGGSTTTMPVIHLATESGAILGDFYLSGGSVDVFGPDLGFDEDQAVYDAMKRGQNLFSEPFRFPFLAGVGKGISYGIAPADGDAFVPLFTASQTAVIGGARDGDGSDERFPDGTGLSYQRYLFIGHGDVGSIVDGWLQATEQPYGTVTGKVVEQSTGLPMSQVDVLVFKPGASAPWSQWKTDVDPRDDRADGNFGGHLPVGDWELLVHEEGRPDSKRVPITVTEGGSVDLSLELPRPGLFTFTVRNERNEPLPAKISIFKVDGDSPRNPVFGDMRIAGAPAAVVWPMYGEGQVELPDGQYFAVATRGLEYEWDVSDTFTIDAERSTHYDFQVTRSVDTDGWVSADLHVHAQPSHDAGVTKVDRVRTMACEGVEFFAGTDHDYITDYSPTIEDLGLEDWVRAAPGCETTTIELGHFLSFPLAQDFTGDAGGAFDWTGMTPEEIAQTLRKTGQDAGYDPVVYIGHPRAGILGYFDQYGFDPYGGTAGTKGNAGAAKVVTPTLGYTNQLLNHDLFTLRAFDGMEVMGTKDHYFFRTATQPELDRYAQDGSTTIYDILKRTTQEQKDLKDGVYHLADGQWGQIDDWFSLLNLGFKLTAMANSDTHSWTTTEAGCPRNYVMSDTDQPAFIEPQKVADAVRDHQVIATYGPFVRLWVNDQGIGSTVVPSDPNVNVTVDVQAPTWMDIDRVELYQNGELIHVFHIDNDSVDRLYDSIQVPMDKDSWFVAIAMGQGDMAPVFTPVQVPYIPLNEVVIDALSEVSAVSLLLPTTVPVPREYPIHPYGLTNPVWVDLDGDGFDAPGIPAWMRPTTE